MYYDNIDFRKFKYANYSRKSSETDERQVQSIPKQERLNMEVIDRDGLTLVDNYSESKSAFKRENRPEFGRLIDDTESGRINAWNCLDATRLSRNAFDAGLIITLMDEGKLHHVRTKWRIYLNTARDKKNLMDEFTESKKDSDSKSENVKMGLTERYRKGLPTGTAPIGFLNDKTREKGDRGWIVDDEKLDKMRLVLGRFLNGNDSIRSIHEYAQSLGVKVSKSRLHSLITSPVYAGFFYSLDEDGLNRTKRELDKMIPRIISEDEHQKVQTILSKRHSPKKQKHELAYTGYLFGSDDGFMGADVKVQVICDCKHKFAYRSKNTCPNCNTHLDKMKKPKYLIYNYYYNTLKRRTKGVSAKTIQEKEIDNYLKSYIDENIAISPKLCEWAKKYLYELHDKEIDEKRAVLKAQESNNEKIHEQLKKLRHQHRNGYITDEEFQEDRKELEERLLSEDSNKTESWLTKMEDVLDLGTELFDIIENGTVKEKRDVLSHLSSNLIWNEEKLNIINAKWMDAYILGLQRAKEVSPKFEPKKYGLDKKQNEPFELACPALLRWLDDVRTCISGKIERMI